MTPGWQRWRAIAAVTVALSSSILSWSTGSLAAPPPSEVPSRGTADVSPEVAQKAAAISRQTMSPFCPGRTLSDCPSGYATEWRRDIRAMVQQGMSAAEIQKVLESRADGNLSGIPNRQSSYALPIALAFGAALLLFLLLRRLRRKTETADEAASAIGSKSKLEGSKKHATDDASKHDKVAAVDDERLRAELDAES